MDSLQLKEWVDSLDNVIEYEGRQVAEELLRYLVTEVLELSNCCTDYINTLSDDVTYPGNLKIEKKIRDINVWNALITVMKANADSNLGGHIATYCSVATLYEVGYNHFWRADSVNGDLVYFQGHASPGIYARSFLEGVLSEKDLLSFRQEVSGGLPSYPHPWLMPNYWQFPTVSMGLGPITAIHQAKLLKYIKLRGLCDVSEKRKVWCFIGDGETSEPESLGNIHIASRDKLDNLIFIVNCNLQGLDGPVAGNSKIIQDLEGVFKGANWKVIKVIWGSNWDKLLKRDSSGKLRHLMMSVLDGEYQDYKSKDGKYVREKFFGKYKETLQLVSDMTDDEIWNLTRGGHDFVKVYNAYYEAVNNSSQTPVVILVKTIKGYGMEHDGQSRNIAHQQKKVSSTVLQHLFNKIKAATIVPDKPDFITLDHASEEYKYLKDKRELLGGSFPCRNASKPIISIPDFSFFTDFVSGSGEKAVSTTMYFVRILHALLKCDDFGKYIVPIVPDELRTFGMQGMVKQFGIWSSVGQLYSPEDDKNLMPYIESKSGQIVQSGINEAGAMSMWIAAASSYANNELCLVPFYIFYSMFGFQRIGDLAWLSGDARCRGFLIGATSGRTTLNGEGLQHADGHSHVLCSTIPSCESYDPAFSYELAVIIHYGLQEMYVQNKDKFYYITVTNENYIQPSMPDGVEQGIINGIYLYQTYYARDDIYVNLLGSGAIMCEILIAAKELSQRYNISVNVFSVTSFNKLYSDAILVSRNNLLTGSHDSSFIADTLNSHNSIITVAVTDYIRAYANQIREYVPNKYIVLGTDGYGRSDSREHLRSFFEIDSEHIVLATLRGLYDLGKISTIDSPLADIKHTNAPWTV